MKRFTGSTQPHRHARPSGVHANPMSLAEGRDFVNGLVIKWMQSLAPSPPSLPAALAEAADEVEKLAGP